MKKIKVSVVMITYNHEKYIKQAIEGVLMQKANFAVELIISNDCSTDNTGKVIIKLTNNYVGNIKIKYYNHNKNKGVTDNFTWSLRQAKGKYIALCEGDDYWTDPLKLQKQVDFLEENEECVVCGTYSDIERYGELETIKKDTPFLEFNLFDIISSNRIPTLTMMFRNNVIDYSVLSNYSLGDVALLLELTKLGGKIAKLNFKSAVYRYHGKGLNSGNSRYKNTKTQFITKYHFAKNLKDQRFKNKLRLYFFRIFLIEIKSFFVRNRLFDFKIFKLAFKYILK